MKRCFCSGMTWSLMRTGVMQLVVEEVVSETLESDNLILQNLSASTHVQVSELSEKTSRT